MAMVCFYFCICVRAIVLLVAPTNPGVLLPQLVEDESRQREVRRDGQRRRLHGESMGSHEASFLLSRWSRPELRAGASSRGCVLLFPRSGNKSTSGGLATADLARLRFNSERSRLEQSFDYNYGDSYVEKRRKVKDTPRDKNKLRCVIYIAENNHPTVQRKVHAESKICAAQSGSMVGFNGMCYCVTSHGSDRPGMQCSKTSSRAVEDDGGLSRRGGVRHRHCRRSRDSCWVPSPVLWDPMLQRGDHAAGCRGHYPNTSACWRCLGGGRAPLKQHVEIMQLGLWRASSSFLQKQPMVLQHTPRTGLLRLWFWFDESAFPWVLGLSFFYIQQCLQYLLEAGMFFSQGQPTLSLRSARPVHVSLTPLRMPSISRFVFLCILDEIVF